MIQEDEKLLIKDLSARLPYGVKALYYDYIEKKEISGVIDVIYTDHDDGLEDCSVGIGYWKLKLTEIKPYLFPLSSMTEEQKKEFPGEVSILNAFIDGSIYLSEDEELTPEDLIEIFDFLNKNHFDYRGLIDKGLALDATGLNIY
jgi:hypothetical protein